MAMLRAEAPGSGAAGGAAAEIFSCRGGIFADAPGLGKTVTMLALVAHTAGTRPAELAATDPAQPYGGVLPWPESGDADASPRREAGATVVIASGAPVLWLGRGGHSLLTFAAADSPTVLTAAVRALQGSLRLGRAATVTKVDGVVSLVAPRASALLRAGFERDGDALRLAFVKRKHQAAGTTFRIGEGPAEASIIELEADAD